jgi:uncharacterized membrane protein
MDEQPAQATDEGSSRQAWSLRASLVRTPEGRVLLLGIGLTLLFALWIGISPLFTESQPHVLLMMTGTEVILGRAAAMTLGYTNGMSHATVVPVVMVLETILVFIFYPFFVFTYNNLLTANRLRGTIQQIRTAAETHKDKVQKYGIIGLFIFVWLPFWMTGPVVGCVIGFLLGLRTWVNMVTVLAGTYVAILGWGLFLNEFQERLAAYGRYAGLGIVLLIVGILFLLQRMHRKMNGDKKNGG